MALLWVTFLVLFACGSAGTDDLGQSTTSTAASSTTAAPPSTTAAPPRPVSSPTLVPDGRPRGAATDASNIVAIGRPMESVDELARAIAHKLTIENAHDEGFRGVTYTTRELRKGIEALIELRVEGIADDSIDGYDYAVNAELTVSGWQITDAARFAICRRSLSGGLCV